ncbi:glycosyltransferase family 2 protein, partial [Geminicoccus flavidas]|uniref:glycosyltransferase family 2 protein n=1 Tax=Geminicoccus flavidas TaxID=2506407 RepID=UPI00135C861E
MRIAVITPYYREPDEFLEQCHRSVLGQTLACDHFFIADGWPNPVVRNWRAKSLELPESHGYGGNLPRVLGSISAFSQGYDAVAFLDADNWYEPSHLEKLADLHVRTGAAVCTSNRTMHRLDGSYMFEDDKNDGRTHVDTSCFFLTRAALPVIIRWALIPMELGPIYDTIYWSSIRSFKLSHAHEQAATLCYRTTYEADYRRIGEALPACAKSLQDTDRPFYWFKSLPAKERWRIWKDLGWPAELHRV